jgi:hypothetical protein
MTATIDLRDLDEARTFLTQGLWLQRVLAPAAATVKAPLDWALEIVSSGQPLPPPGFVADLGHATLGADWEIRGGRESHGIPGVPAGLLRTYEDHVLGKVSADWTFARAADAVRRYAREEARQQARGVAYVINQFRDRAEFRGAELSPGVIKGLREMPPQEVLALGWESLNREGLHPALTELYQSLISAARRTPEILGPEDVDELERGMHLKEFGERFALRQVLQVANRLAATLPAHRIRPLAGRQEVPTRVLDEDTYPVGGFSSLSTRGTIESLLHSQLAFMEQQERPDLFDIKYLRDELLYYARDENQFRRRRRSFLFALYPDLVHTRVKDPSLPYQRGVLLLGLLLATVRKLVEWLSTDALTFVFHFIDDAKEGPLQRERELIEMMLRELIENGTVVVQPGVAARELPRECALRARRSLCHCLTVSTEDRRLEAPDTVVTRFFLDGPRPALGGANEDLVYNEEEEPFDAWAAALLDLLQRWI